MCECYKIGGPFISEDPDCPVHGHEAQQLQREHEEEIGSLQEQIGDLRRELLQLRTEFQKHVKDTKISRMSSGHE